MTKPTALLDLLATRGRLLADGATGSNLFARGLQSGDAPELWNATRREVIADQYASFIDAGADIVLTNTFGGNRYRLQLHAAGARVAELNGAGAQLARDLVDAANRPIIVAGSMGPSGEIMQPIGSLSEAAASAAFAEQALALKQGGVDVLWLETFAAREEARAAILGAAQADLPIAATFSIDTNGRTMMGLAAADIVDLCRELDAPLVAIGVNCGVGAAETIAALINMRAALTARAMPIALIAKANCGVPKYIDGEIVYSGSERLMCDYVRLAVDAGADIIGGCCGTTANHIGAMRATFDTHRARAVPSLASIEQQLGAVSKGARVQMQGDLSIAGAALRAPSTTRPRRRAR